MSASTYSSKYKRTSGYCDPFHPSHEMQSHYELKTKDDKSWRPKCVDCNTSRTMIKCKHSYYCAICECERSFGMVLITRGNIR